VTETARERNRRGEGTRLRADILAAAAELLEETGSEQDVTLRAVARRVGISAPSIYAHFPDREAIVDAVVDDAFAELKTAITTAADAETLPRQKLRAGCAAYLRFAREQPNRYRLVFELRNPLDADHPGRTIGAVRGETFQHLVDTVQLCIDGGISTSTDAFGDAVAIWAALHGYATLRSGHLGFPWPPYEQTFDRIVDGLAHLTPAASEA
jgi:AcrR family transcriptional regulator